MGLWVWGYGYRVIGKGLWVWGSVPCVLFILCPLDSDE